MKNNLPQFNKNRQGQTLVPVMICAVLIGIVAASIPSILNYLNTQHRLTRIKMQVNQVANRVRLVLSDGSNYNTSATICKTDPTLCPLKTNIQATLFAPSGAAVAKFYPKVLGARCDIAEFPTGVCGIRVKKISVNSVEVRYEGKDVIIKPIVIPITPPSKAIGVSLTCPDNQILKGIKKDSGEADCVPLITQCDAGKLFVPSATGVGECMTIQSSEVKCPDENFVISKVEWKDNKLGADVECAAQRINPDGGAGP